MYYFLKGRRRRGQKDSSVKTKYRRADRFDAMKICRDERAVSSLEDSRACLRTTTLKLSLNFILFCARSNHISSTNKVATTLFFSLFLIVFTFLFNFLFAERSR